MVYVVTDNSQMLAFVSLTLSASSSLNTPIGTSNSPSAPWEFGTILVSTTWRKKNKGKQKKNTE